MTAKQSEEILLNLMEYGSEIEYREVLRKDIFQKTTDEALPQNRSKGIIQIKEEENRFVGQIFI